MWRVDWASLLELWEPCDLRLDGGVVLDSGLVEGRDPALVLHPAARLKVVPKALADGELIVVLSGA